MRKVHGTPHMPMAKAVILWICSELSDSITRIFTALPEFEFTPVLHDQDLPEYVAQVARGAVVVHVPSAGASKCSVLLETVHQVDPGLPIIFYDPRGAIANPVDLVRQGAFCLLAGDLCPEKLESLLQTEIAHDSTSQLANLSENVDE